MNCLELILEKYLAYINGCGSLFSLALAVENAPQDLVGVPESVLQLVGSAI